MLFDLFQEFGLIHFFLHRGPIFRHTCATCSKLQSNINTRVKVPL